MSGNANFVGGLVGKLITESYDAIISNCYASGRVQGNSLVGGLVGEVNYSESYSSSRVMISNSYSKGSVVGESFVGGLAGCASSNVAELQITDSLSYSTVSGNDVDSTGSLIGATIITKDNTQFGKITVTNAQATSQGMDAIGGAYMYDYTTYTLLSDYDMTSLLAGISFYVPEVTSLTLQVGTNSDGASQITFDMAFRIEGVDELRQIGVNTSEDTITLLDNLIEMVNNKQTLYGAVENRLMSVLEEVATKRDNLVSSRSTIRDADIAEVSSHYIPQQILQQASATLLATANQSPAIALQLI